MTAGDSTILQGQRGRGEAPGVSVDISAFMRGIAHQLAMEMERRSVLHILYTSHPGTIPGISSAHLCNPFHLKLIEAALLRIAPWDGARERIWEWSARWYDKYVARRVYSNQSVLNRVLHGWASHCKETLQVAKTCGYKTFLESACPHPVFKTKLLLAEAERMGVPYKECPRWIDTVNAECELADRIVVPSTYSYQSFVELGYPRSKLVKVPLGVNVAEITPPKDRGVKTEGRRPFTVLMVGTDALRKGAYYLLRAWQKLRLKDAELVIRCGVTKNAQPLLSQPGVRHIAGVSRTELIRLYQEATIFCFPSIDDGFGLVVLEAMAAGLPVIISENVGAKDLINDGVEGFVIPIRDIQRLCEKIEYFYENPESVAAMGVNARKLAEQHDWSRYGDMILNAYRSSMT